MGRVFDLRGAGELVLLLVLYRGDIAEGGVQPRGIVGVFQVRRQRRQQLPHGAVALQVHLLVLERLHEAFDVRVVVWVPAT